MSLNRMSMMESVRIRRRQVFNMNIIIIFFQKLSCTNHLFNLAKAEIFYRVCFMKFFESKNIIIIEEAYHHQTRF